MGAGVSGGTRNGRRGGRDGCRVPARVDARTQASGPELLHPFATIKFAAHSLLIGIPLIQYDHQRLAENL